MAIAKKEPGNTLETLSKSYVDAHIKPIIDSIQVPGTVSKDRSIARSVSINNTFGAGWFKDYAQTVPMEDAVKKAFEVAGQIEAWLTR